MSVAEDRSGSGGIEMGIALPPERMARFRRWLTDAIAWVLDRLPNSTRLLEWNLQRIKVAMKFSPIARSSGEMKISVASYFQNGMIMQK
uniref:Uncharacterized protein n=1 Tax=Oryza glumipatula TaxID=40148 RepID=A0A0D9ZQB1_9ORYZ